MSLEATADGEKKAQPLFTSFITTAQYLWLFWLKWVRMIFDSQYLENLLTLWKTQELLRYNMHHILYAYICAYICLCIYAYLLYIMCIYIIYIYINVACQ